MEQAPQSEGALVRALNEAEAPPLEAMFDIVKEEGKLRGHLHISGTAFREADMMGCDRRDDDVTCAIKVIFGEACWEFLVACIDCPSDRPALVILIDAPQPDMSLRKQLMKAVNRGVQLPCILFGFTRQGELEWIGRLVSHLLSRGHRASSLYLGDEVRMLAPRP